MVVFRVMAFYCARRYGERGEGIGASDEKMEEPFGPLLMTLPMFIFSSICQSEADVAFFQREFKALAENKIKSYVNTQVSLKMHCKFHT